MAFFGLTYLGGGDVFKDFTPKDPISLGSISDDKFMEAFDKYAIGDTSLALDLQVRALLPVNVQPKRGPLCY
jgi:hypothetical protein